MSECETHLIGDLFDLENGYAFKSSEFTEVGVPVIKIKNIKANRFSEHEFGYVSPEFLDQKKDKLARKDDLLISMSGNRHDGSPETWVGKVCLFRKDGQYFINQRVSALRAKKNVQFDLDFASYVLSSFDYQNLFISIATSSGGQANLSPSQVMGTKITLPDFHYQKKAGGLLRKIDDKIELNQRMNETLEAMARALFKSWFVDFDPVRAKAEGSKPEGMDVATAKLFPAAFNDDGLPEGWTRGTLGKIADSAGVTVQPNQTSSDTPYIGLEHMPRRCVALSEWAGAGKVTSNKFAFKRGDFLFGKLRPYFHKVGIAAIDGISSTDILIVRSKQEEFYAFVLSVISSDEFVSHTDQTSRGTKMPRTNWKDMAAYAVTLPDKRVAAAYNLATKPMLEQIIVNVHENRTLSGLRNTLLPKLISGELRIGDVEDRIKEAV